MAETFHIQITSMDGLQYEGEVRSISCRVISGDKAILARHSNYCSAIGMGTAKVVFEDGSVRYASCIGGMVTMMNNNCRLITTTWEWSDEIDVDRAKRAKERAKERMDKAKASDKEYRIAESKLKRSLVRIDSATRFN